MVEGPPLPDWLAAALDRCLRDLQQPAVVDLGVGLSPDGASLVISERSGSACWFDLAHQEPGEELVVDLADVLQEELLESAEAWGEARPACPGHPHPAQADLVSSEAWWTCPDDERRLWRIGSYGVGDPLAA